MDGDLEALPDDLLAGILRRLPPGSLAVSRCVCKAWRATVDGRRLLHTDLLPLSLGGGGGRRIIVTLNGGEPRNSSPVLRRRGVESPASSTTSHTTDRTCGGTLSSMTTATVWSCSTTTWSIRPHGDGRSFPPPPPPFLPPRAEREAFAIEEDGFLVFDPAVSPHYEVVIIPSVRQWCQLDPTTDGQEWPPSPYILRVFSSGTTGRWEERQFIKEGEAIATVADMRIFGDPLHHLYPVYRSAVLYKHCQSDFLMRIILSQDKYQVIKFSEMPEHSEPYLGKSKEGVYCAMVDHSCKLRV